jgi:hypothetical protein
MSVGGGERGVYSRSGICPVCTHFSPHVPSICFLKAPHLRHLLRSSPVFRHPSQRAVPSRNACTLLIEVERLKRLVSTRQAVGSVTATQHKNAREGHAPRRRSRDATSSGESRHPQLDERRYRLDSSIAGAEINKER